MDKYELTNLRRHQFANRFIAFVVWLFVIGIHASLLFAYYSHPNDGLGGGTGKIGFWIEQVFHPDLADQIDVGDWIIAVDGQPAASDYYNRFTQSPYAAKGLKAGTDYSYTIQKGSDPEKVFDIEVPIRQIPLFNYLQIQSFGIAIALIFSSLGLFLILSKPLDKKVWLFFLVILFISFSMPGTDGFLCYNDIFALNFLFILNTELLLPPVFAMLLHFALIFPRVLYTPKQRGFILSAVYGVWLIPALIGIVSLLTRNVASYQILFATIQILSALEFMAAIGVMIFSYRTSDSYVQKAQLRWILWAFFLAGFFSVGVNEFAWLFWQEYPIPYNYILLLSTIIPFSVIVSLTRYRLFSIDRIINKTLVYGLMSFLLFGIYIAASAVLSFVLQQQTKIPSSIDIFSLAIVILFFNPLHMLLQKLIDRIFYRGRINAQILLHDISQELAVSTNYAQLLAIVSRKIPKLLNLNGAWLFRFNGMQTEQIISDTGFLSNLFSQSISRYLHKNKLTDSNNSETISYIEREKASPLEIKLFNFGVQMIVLLKHANQLVGVFALSQKKANTAFSMDEIYILESVSYQIATSLINAQTFNELHTKEAENQSIITSISEGIVVLDNNLQISKLNDAMMKLLGIKPEQVNSTAYSYIFALEDENKNGMDMDPIIQTLKDQKPYSGFHYLHSFYNQKKTPISVFINPLKTKSNTSNGVVMTIYDRTEDIKLLSAKDSFIGIVTHELRTPISSMSMYTNQLIEESTDLTNEKKFLLNRVAESLNRLNSRFNQIVEVAEFESENQNLEITQIDLVHSVSEMVKLILPRVADKNIEIDFQSDPRQTFLVRANSGLVLQTLDNLVSNAIDYTLQGNIDIKLHRSLAKERIQPAGLSQNPNYAIVEVTDSGKGLDEETAKHLFEPFIQQGGFLQRDEAKGGLGLGLYLAKMMVEKMRGTIWYQPRADQTGSSFFFSLPLILKAS